MRRLLVRLLAAARALPRSLFWDALSLAGMVFLTVGLGQVYAPLGWIAPGAALLALGVLGAKRCS